MINRVSWKSVAENLIAHMSREQMQWVYDYHRGRLKDKHDLMDEEEVAASRQTVKFMARAIADYDLAFK